MSNEVIVLIVIAFLIIAISGWIASSLPHHESIATYRPPEYQVPAEDTYPSKALWALDIAAHEFMMQAATMNKYNLDVFRGATINIADGVDGLADIIERLSNFADGPSTVEEVCDAIYESSVIGTNTIVSRLKCLLATEIGSCVVVNASIPSGADMTTTQVADALRRIARIYRDGRITILPLVV